MSLSSSSDEFVKPFLRGLFFPAWFDQASRQWQVFAAAVGLVALPVFVEAPLVRVFPWLSLAMTLAWLGGGIALMRRPEWRLWGDLLVGFSWTWLAGSVYWGWLRWEPLVHLPVEAIGLPIVAVCLWRNWGRVGSYFYLGSLLGTAVTDFYTNWMDLFPAWRQLMAVDVEFVPVVLREAAATLQTDLAAHRAAVLILFLIFTGVIPLLYSRYLFWWAFGGAVLSTLIVDGLFFFSACLA